MKKIIISLITLVLLLCSCHTNDLCISNQGSYLDELSEKAYENSEIIYESSYNESSQIINDSFVDESDLIDDTSEDVDGEMNNYTYFKGVWLSQFDLYDIYLNNGAQRDKESFVALMRVVFENLKNDGYNSVIVQVRPYADSYYPSEYYPISNYVSGSFGVEDIYDPIEILVPLAHEYGLEFHAWLNPMRGMKQSELENVPDNYPIKVWYNDDSLRNKYLSIFNDRVYLNPAYEEVRSLIANGAGEVAAKYEVDGVHIDDYFYPTTDKAFDSISYEEYKNKGGNATLEEFRRNNLDLMVSGMYSAIKAANSNAAFGISPAGNIDNTYKLMYADVYKWCSEKGYLDYICPQIYFGLEHSTHDFKKIYNVWSSIIKEDSIKLYVGMTLGKAVGGVDNYAGDGKYEWLNNKDVLKRCIDFLAEQDDCFGVVMFCYQHMYDPLTGASVSSTIEERENYSESFNKLGS